MLSNRPCRTATAAAEVRLLHATSHPSVVLLEKTNHHLSYSPKISKPSTVDHLLSVQLKVAEDLEDDVVEVLVVPEGLCRNVLEVQGVLGGHHVLGGQDVGPDPPQDLRSVFLIRQLARQGPNGLGLQDVSFSFSLNSWAKNQPVVHREETSTCPARSTSWRGW